MHRRPELPEKASADLRARQGALDAQISRKRTDDARKRCIDEHWVRFAERKTRAHSVVVTLLRAMASGADAQCMYCERDRGSQIDHFVPRRSAPGRALAWENFVWSCAICNVQKLDTGAAGLLDPTRDDPRDHFRLTSSGTYQPLTERGRVTEAVFPWLARDEGLAQGRRDARASIARCLLAYAARRDEGNVAGAEVIRRELVRHPFSDVLDALLALAILPGAPKLLSSEERAALAACPEVAGWLAEADALRLAEARAKAALDATTIRTRAVVRARSHRR